MKTKFVKLNLLKTQGDVKIEAIKVLEKLAKLNPIVGTSEKDVIACRFCYAKGNTKNYAGQRNFHKKKCLWLKANDLMKIYEELE